MDSKISRILQNAKPVDYSFKHLKQMEALPLEAARTSRIGTVERGTEKNKFLTKSVWLNNNFFKTTKNFDVLIESLLEHPEMLSWIDLSFNYIVDIDQTILKYPNLKIVYLHGNCIEKFDEVFKLRELKQLRTLTLHGNPLANYPNYRACIIAAIPQILNLDFARVIDNEKLVPPPPEFIKKLKMK